MFLHGEKEGTISNRVFQRPFCFSDFRECCESLGKRSIFYWSGPKNVERWVILLECYVCKVSQNWLKNVGTLVYNFRFQNSSVNWSFLLTCKFQGYSKISQNSYFTTDEFDTARSRTNPLQILLPFRKPELQGNSG